MMYYNLQELRFEDYSCNRIYSSEIVGLFTSQVGSPMGGATETNLFSSRTRDTSKKQKFTLYKHCSFRKSEANDKSKEEESW